MTPAQFDQCPLPVLGFGPGWLVTEKPSGMSTHNDPEHDLCALLKHYLRENDQAACSVALDTNYGLHPVHRLDRETSGLVLLSCRRDVSAGLAQQFTHGQVTKTYLALAHGSVPPTDDWAPWQWPLTPKASGRRNPRGSGRKTPCRTLYRCLERSRHYSLLECRLVTGRTHQVRRHAALAGHPLVGDRRYGSLRACRYLEKHHRFKRLGLHAVSLKFRPPEFEVPHTFKSARLPMALAQLLDDDM